MAKRFNEKTTSIVKDALPSYALLLQDEYKKLTRGVGTNYAVAPQWLVGHNRHATRGSIIARNAHPFQHGNITLVHNGTLSNQGLLPDAKQFEVDSENICYSIDKIGAAETIQKLDGAYTLIWHDNSDDTLHIIRNEERPFHLCRVGQDWFGASEEDMLMWLLKRSKTHKSRIGEHFECKVGVEYIFDVAGRKMVLSEEKEHKLPVFTYATRWGNYSGTSWLEEYEDEYRARNRQSAVARGVNSSISSGTKDRIAADIARQNQLAIELGLDIRRDQIVEFIPCMFEPYSGTYSAGKGKMTGYVFDDKACVYYEIDTHNVLKSDYEKAIEFPNVTYEGTVSCLHKVDNMLRAVVISGKFKGFPEEAKEPDITQQDDDIPFDPRDDYFTNQSGVKVTRKFWEAHAHGECGGCGKHIKWSDAPKAVYAYQAYWHPDCLKGLSAPAPDGSDDEVAICAICSKLKYDRELDTQMSAARQEDICKDCAEEIYAKARKQEKAREDAKANSEPRWFKVIDRTSTRNPEISLRITPEMFQKFILMGAVSVRSDIEFKDLDKCYIEKRAAGHFAYAMLPDGVKSPYTREEAKKEEVEKSPKSQPSRKGGTLSLRKCVKSIDGKRTLDVTKALWGTIGFCEFCYKQIPWKDVESCTLGEYNRIVCPCDKCKGKVNGSQKNSS